MRRNKTAKWPAAAIELQQSRRGGCPMESWAFTRSSASW